MLLLLALAAAPAALAQETNAPTRSAAYGEDVEEADLVSTLQAQGRFNTLVQALERSGLADELRTSPTAYTLFAPTDEAFAKLPPGTLEALTPEQLADVLRHHLVAAEVDIDAAAAEMGRAQSVLGPELTFEATGDGVEVSDAAIVGPEAKIGNDVVLPIDAVLLPPDLAPAEQDMMHDDGMQDDGLAPIPDEKSQPVEELPVEEPPVEETGDVDLQRDYE